MKNNEQIAIVGATSHIAKGLIVQFAQRTGTMLHLFARAPERVQQFLTEQHIPTDTVRVLPLTQFGERTYDTIINCIGLGTPSKQRTEDLRTIVTLTEQYDDLVLDHISAHPGTVYINCSSGAVYGTDFTRPAEEGTDPVLHGTDIRTDDLYTLAKFRTEKKHRTLTDRAIIDVRIFSYISPLIDLNAGYLITEIMKCIRDRSVFTTDDINIVRDYTGPEDLSALIGLAMEQRSLNGALDVFSAAPVSKLDLLAFCKERYGLDYTVTHKAGPVPGTKMNYFSKNTRPAADIGFSPRYSSLENIERTLQRTVPVR